MPETAWTQSHDERKSLLINMSKWVMEKYISCCFNSPHRRSSDGVNEYTRNLLSIACIYLLFKDAIKKEMADEYSSVTIIYFLYLLTQDAVIMPMKHSTSCANTIMTFPLSKQNSWFGVDLLILLVSREVIFQQTFTWNI